MELMAVIIGLEQLKTPDLDVHIYTDSKYVADAFNQNWIHGWAKRGFTKIKNPDLWKRMYTLYKKYNPAFHWVKGHAGNPDNERVDKLAVRASQSEKLHIDRFFEHQEQTIF